MAIRLDRSDRLGFTLGCGLKMSRQKSEEGRLWEQFLNHKESSIYDCSTIGSESIVKPLSGWMYDLKLRPSNDKDQRPDELKFEGIQSLESSDEFFDEGDIFLYGM